MPESHGRKVFRIQLTLPVVILLTTLSTFSLVAAFYLGMVTEKSMQRPPEFPEVETNLTEEEPLSEEDLKFFGLSERNKEQESINLEELRDLKKKTEELIKKPVTPELKTPEKPKPVTPKKPKSNSLKETDLKTSYYGIVVSKRVGNAVKRNYTKRRVREAIRSSEWHDSSKNIKLVLIMKKNVLDISFIDLKDDINKFLKLANEETKKSIS